jgi:hypothetical protein
METPENEELFTIRLNKTGIASIRLLARVVNVSVILSSILWLVTSYYSVITYIQYKELAVQSYLGDSWVAFQYKYAYWLTFIYMIIFLFGIFYSWIFARRISRGVNSMDEDQFNKSFRLLVISATLIIIGDIINIAVYGAAVRNFHLYNI